MGETTTVRLKSGRHRRPGDGEGTGEVFEEGDVFEATEREMEAFGDRFEEVEQTNDGWEPTRSEPGVEEPEDGMYRLLAGEHRTTDDDGNAVIIEEGDEVYLTEQEAEAFGDKFEKVESDDGEEDEAGDENAEEAGETEATLATPDADVKLPDEFPDSVPDADAWDWDALREVSKANDVDASQSKPDQVADLRSIANAGS
ncbi:MAG: hypothetical protein SV760_07965 [Halobacteria archaeon]|nr:hypothetical protein [Halobacteria archaeon]